MTTITLEIPDDLASQIDPLHPAYQEMIDFLASSPTPEQIIAHRPSALVQERLAELLEKNREDGLTEAEMAELDLYEQIDDLMSLLKARVAAGIDGCRQVSAKINQNRVTTNPPI